MERKTTNGREKRLSKKKNDVHVKVLCLSPKPGSNLEHGTSVYEINIQSDIQGDIHFCSPNKERRKIVPVEEFVAMENENMENMNKKNLLIESYYPSIVDSHIPGVGNPTEIEERSPKTDGEFGIEEKKNMLERVDKESQCSPFSPSEFSFKSNVKNLVLENFISKNSDWKPILDKEVNAPEKSELHLHHHEHHHYHYYYHDATAVSNEKIPSKNPPAMFQRTPEATAEVKETPNSRLFPKLSNRTFVMSLPQAEAKEVTEELPEQDRSAESLYLRGSDFIKSHTYSEEDVVSYEIEEAETNLEPSKKGNKSVFSTLVDSLKNLQDLKSPVVITDQESIPRISYITCECESTDTLSHIMESDCSFDNSSCCLLETPSDANNIAILTTNPENASLEGEDLTGRYFCNKCKEKFSNQVQCELWNAKILQLLKQIRRKLIKIERNYSGERKSGLEQSGVVRGGQPVSVFGASHKVVVTSCKTFVFVPELLDECSQIQEPNAGRQFKRLHFEEVELNTRSICDLRNFLRENQT